MPARVPAPDEGREFGLEKTLPAEAYRSAEAFEAERERLFAREWFCAGREQEVPHAGDFLALDVLGERILVVRAKDGALHAFYDVCRHRGCRLSLMIADAAGPHAEPVPTGRFKGAIRCPYHAWTYGLDGELRAAPFLPEDEQFRKKHLGLHPVGVERWGGFMFVHLTPGEARPLGTQLGATPERVRTYPLADLRAARRIVYDVGANWKVLMENYNECYHCGPVHPELCEIVPAFREQGGGGLDWEAGVPQKEGTFTFTRSGTSDRAPFPGLSEEERTRHKGEIAYPNLLLSLSADHVAAFTLWPQGPARTTIVCDFLFHPEEMARETFDPSDAVEFWDLVNRQDWTVCEGVQQGMSSRAFRYGYFAPMEDQNLDIRRYVGERLGGED
jgi:Rieske 2Fe-2S family protein